MSAIGGLGGAQAPQATNNAFDAFTSEDFLRLMFSELTNQDPLSPNETKDLIDQIGQIRSIEADVNLSEQLERIVSRSEIASAGNLVGSYVVGQSEAGLTTEGLVLSVSVTTDGPVLNLHNNARVPLNLVEEFVDPDAFANGPGEPRG
jgi:flagellar basal-body rod modification protein FlgD